MRRALTGAWIETAKSRSYLRTITGRAPTGAWIETLQLTVLSVRRSRRALTGAWIETSSYAIETGVPLCRALTGAWIETSGNISYEFPTIVAPSRARGLKLASEVAQLLAPCRALTGAWIETRTIPASASTRKRRALTGAWIETLLRVTRVLLPAVAPSRARGLKRSLLDWCFRINAMSRPHGRVD